MKMSPDSKISRRQFFFILVQTQIGVGILALPYDLHLEAGQDGWISLILSGIFIQFVILTIWLTLEAFPGCDLFQIFTKMFGKWIGNLFNLIYYLYFVAVSALILMLFGRMIHLWILPNTPFWLLASLLAVTCIYLISSGLVVMARIYTFVSFLLVIMLCLTLYIIPDIQLVYLLPIGEASIPQIGKGAHTAMIAMLGFISLFIVYPHVEGTSRQKLKSASLANAFVTSFYLFITLMAFSYFSTAEIELVPQPVMFLLKSIEFYLIGRVDLFLISMWIVSVATSFSTYFYMASRGLSVIFQTNEFDRCMYFTVFLPLILSLTIGIEEITIDRYSVMIKWLATLLSVCVPFVMTLISLIFFRRHRRKEA
ncbi:GerAB/ArcD/ProY family transporter [Sediminibacillus massiliensis]|uniref:GerAB/ArcD/ProY family transporter n=1 Tax=Sediminibacillus massiliensis TaxID=1926277 RepID=UPI0015C3B091|nr:GerAB/ArcD/ProY family transporter [Sediminibacillus massiliensis]